MSTLSLERNFKWLTHAKTQGLPCQDSMLSAVWVSSCPEAELCSLKLAEQQGPLGAENEGGGIRQGAAANRSTS